MHPPMTLSAAEIIRMLGLKPHPEGGHFPETHRDARADGRAHSTAIYFLLARGERSHWHRVDAAEVWHYYAGSALQLEMAASGHGPIERVTLGAEPRGRRAPAGGGPGACMAGGREPRRLDAGGLHGRAGIRVRGLRARSQGLVARDASTK